MAFDLISATDTSFSVTAAAATGANGEVMFGNFTQSPVTGTVTISRSGLTPSPTFQLDLEPGEVFTLRNETAATSYDYAGTFKHTRVKAALAHEYNSSVEEGVDATGQATDRAALIVVQNVTAT